jgi:Zn-dependent metalloprotease
MSDSLGAARVSVVTTIRTTQRVLADAGVRPGEHNDTLPRIKIKGGIDDTSYMPFMDTLQVGVAQAHQPDIVAHEYAHRVLEAVLGDSAASGDGEAATVQESLADIVAVTVDGDDWQLGEDAATGQHALRVLDDPARGQVLAKYGNIAALPANMRQFVHTDKDHGGAHINAGIPNRAASIIGKRVGRQRMLAIFIAAARALRGRELSIAALARATVAVTQGIEREMVRAAWAQVGVAT